MTEEMKIYIEIRLVIDNLPKEQQMKVVKAKCIIEDMFKEYGDEGKMALALIGAKLAAEA